MTKRKTKPKAPDGIEKFPINCKASRSESIFSATGSVPSELHPSHLEIETTAPEREPLPITETGYLSHFAAVEEIDEAGGPSPMSRHGLTMRRRARSGKRKAKARQQLSLFSLPLEGGRADAARAFQRLDESPKSV